MFNILNCNRAGFKQFLILRYYHKQLSQDVNGNASQPEPRAIEDIKNEPQELVNWSEATVPVDILPEPESNLDLLEQNSVVRVFLS